MRKGILSLSGRGKTAAKKKTSNMELAEQTAAKKSAAAAEAKTEAKEKDFVQTIMVPKQNTVVKKAKRKTDKTRK